MRIAFVLISLFVITCGCAHAEECSKRQLQDYEACIQEQEDAVLGKYLCIFDHIAGIQGSDGRRTASSIRSPTDRFFVELSRDNTVDCSNFLPIYLPTIGGPACKSRFKLSVQGLQLLSEDWPYYSATYTQQFTNLRGEFVIAHGQFSSDNKLTNSYTYEGRCEKVSGRRE